MSRSLVGSCNVGDFILSASALSSPSLDLSGKGILELPSELPGCFKLESLYLSGNKLSMLPESLFTSCPNLRWLDLRNNKLKALPPSIEKLKYLRTLLLEGNQLVSLPPQLGRLEHLGGLNLSHNPLQCPPRHIIEKGTKAVIKYLRDLLYEEESERELESATVLMSADSRHTSVPLQPIENNTSLVSAGRDISNPHKTHNQDILPLPQMKQVTLHTQQTVHSNRHSTQYTPSSARHRPHPLHHKWKRKNKRETTVSSSAIKTSTELSPLDKQEINRQLDQQKTKASLEEWRDEARELKRQQEYRVHIDGQLTYPKAVDMAPFGTEENPKGTDRDDSPAKNTLMGMDASISQRQHFTGSGGAAESTDCLRAVRAAEVEERVQKYMIEMADKRKQAGIIKSPSSQLLEAERRLAQAMILRKQVEDRRQREYRLTAFTGDI